MNQTYKFGTIDDGDRKFDYSNIWSREKTTGPSRLVIAPSGNQISLLIDLCRTMEAPFWILYVLLVPRGQAPAGRYQVPEPMPRKSMEDFLERFREFFEGDARHHVWIGSASSSDLLVYDNHNVIYAYGELQRFEQILTAHGLLKTENVQFPDPHTHNYNPEFDGDEADVLRMLDWKHFPLHEDD
jgi:hypothetical protein